MAKESRRTLWLEAINITGAFCGIASLMLTLRIGGTLSHIASIMVSLATHF